MMTNKRRRNFRAVYIRRDNSTGIGIVEHDERSNGNTIAIHSLFIDNEISNRDAHVNIFQIIRNSLDDDEKARLLMHQFQRGNGYQDAYKPRLQVKRVTYKTGLTYEAELLANDAIKRQGDIIEHFNIPLYFSVLDTEKEAGAL